MDYKTTTGSKNQNPTPTKIAPIKPKTPTTKQPIKNKPEKAKPLKFELKDLTDWPGGLDGTLVIKFPIDLFAFKLRVETDIPISSFKFWDADVAPTKGKVFTVTNKDYFGGKKKGEMEELGFQMRFKKQATTG